jgi:hypothetical protein
VITIITMIVIKPTAAFIIIIDIIILILNINIMTRRRHNQVGAPPHGPALYRQKDGMAGVVRRTIMIIILTTTTTIIII